MRRSLICIAAALLLALALKGTWGSALGPDGSQVAVSLYGVSQQIGQETGGPIVRECSWWFTPGELPLCDPAAPFAFAVLKLVYPLMGVAVAFMLVAAIPPIGRRRAGVVMVTMASLLAVAGTTAAIASMPSALGVLNGLGFTFGGASFVSALAAVAVLGICVSSFISQSRSWTGIGNSFGA